MAVAHKNWWEKCENCRLDDGKRMIMGDGIVRLPENTLVSWSNGSRRSGGVGRVVLCAAMAAPICRLAKLVLAN
jgi:hypothetical protein